MNQLLYVGLGGGLGAMLRYAVGLLPWRGAFPLATLAVNLLGAVAIGFLAGVVTQRQVDQRIQQRLAREALARQQPADRDRQRQAGQRGHAGHAHAQGDGGELVGTEHSGRGSAQAEAVAAEDFPGRG